MFGLIYGVPVVTPVFNEGIAPEETAVEVLALADRPDDLPVDPKDGIFPLDDPVEPESPVVLPV